MISGISVGRRYLLALTVALGIAACGNPVQTASPIGSQPVAVGSEAPAASSSALVPTPTVGATPTPQPTVDPNWITRPALSCGEGPLFPPVALEIAGAEFGFDAAADALRETIRHGSSPESPLPAVGWRRVAESSDEVLFVAPGSERISWAQVLVVPGGAGWTARTYGECHLQVSLPDGLGRAEWSLDQAWPAPDARTTELHVLILESACAGGRSPEGRIEAPVVLDGATAVTIAIAVRSLPGAQDCIGNPSFAVLVHLPAAIGIRALMDGGDFPPRQVWP